MSSEALLPAVILMLLPAGAAAADVLPSIETKPTADALLRTSSERFGVDADGCPTYVAPDEILVCGPPEEARRQKLPLPSLPPPSRHPEPIVGTDAAKFRGFNCGTSATGYGCLRPNRLVGVAFGGGTGSGGLTTEMPLMTRIAPTVSTTGKPEVAGPPAR